MPTYEITGPDGKKYRITGDSPEGAMQALQKHVSTGPKGDASRMSMSQVWTDDMLFGFPGKAAAGMNALIRAPFTDKSIGEEYSSIRDQYKADREAYASENPIRNAAASIGGSVMGANKLMGAGLTASRLLPAGISGARGVAGTMAVGAADGAAFGALSALGHDENVGTGALVGGVTGGLAYPVTQAARGVGNMVGGMFGIGNDKRAQAALAEALARSGKSADDVVDDLARAAREGQPEFMVADSLGNSGQRMLTGVARSPGDMRQTIAETLQQRQMGQGDRLSQALARGFNAPDTAAQRTASLAADRSMLANVNYQNARTGAGAVDVSGALREIDDVLRPGVNRVVNPGSGIADDSLEGVVRRAQSLLTDGKSQITDFDSVMRAKQDIADVIGAAQRQGKNNQVRLLSQINARLDEALERASPGYRAANDAFRAQSRTIDAVETGRNAASGRTRASDNIRQFEAMQPGEQNAFRAGYVDPLIAKVEASSMSPTTNKARALITTKTDQEFPAFAIPQRADRMGRQIAREQRMFETANAALGGSKTADNLADAAEMGVFDPSMIGAVLSGNFKGAAIQGLTQGANALQGRNNQTRDMIARMLLQTSPTKATAELAKAVATGKKITKNQELIIRSLIGGIVPSATGVLSN